MVWIRQQADVAARTSLSESGQLAVVDSEFFRSINEGVQLLTARVLDPAYLRMMSHLAPVELP